MDGVELQIHGKLEQIAFGRGPEGGLVGHFRVTAPVDMAALMQMSKDDIVINGFAKTETAPTVEA